MSTVSEGNKMHSFRCWGPNWKSLGNCCQNKRLSVTKICDFLKNAPKLLYVSRSNSIVSNRPFGIFLDF